MTKKASTTVCKGTQKEGCMDSTDVVGNIASIVLLALPITVVAWCLYEIWKETHR